MTPAISRLRKLVEAATPGPWRSGRLDMRSFDAATGEQHKNIYGPNFEPKLHLGNRIPVEVAKAVGDNSLEDAALIAALRNSITALLDLVEAADLMRETGASLSVSVPPLKGHALACLDAFNDARADFHMKRAALEREGGT